MRKFLITPTPGNRVVRMLAAVGGGPLRYYNKQIMAAIYPLRKRGKTLREMAEFLNRKKLFTFRGHPWKIARLSQTIKSLKED